MRINSSRSLFALALGAAAISCGSADEPENMRVALPAAPANGMRITLPDMVFEPGEDKQLCWFTTLPGDQDAWIQTIQAHQAAGGHHLIIFSTSEDVPDGTVEDCSDGARMKLWRLVFTPISSEGSFSVPDGYGIKLPVGTKLVFQVHYINARAKPFVVQDAVDFVRPASTENIVRVAPFSTGIVDFVIPPGSRHAVTYECPIEQDMYAFTGFGHMHEQGESLLVVAGTPGAMEEVYRVDEWNAGHRDQPPLLQRSFEAPYQFKAGSVLRTTCTWNSNADTELGFPKEMCASAFWVYPAQEPITCAGVTLP